MVIEAPAGYTYIQAKRIYSSAKFKVSLGIEPRLPESESEVIPLHYETVISV
jgi:hypothetical protein